MTGMKTLAIAALLTASILVAPADAAEVDNAAWLATQLRAAEAAARADANARQLDEALEAYFAGRHTDALAGLAAAAEDGVVEAMHWLGVIYETGGVAAPDDEQAARWYQEAVDESDYAPAQYRLGVMYEFGRGVGKDDATAVELYRDAAEQGHVDAQRNLGSAYERGWVEEKDLAESFRWYQRAADQGDDIALSGAERIARQLKAENVELSEIEAAMVEYYSGDAFRAVSGFTALTGDRDEAGMSWLGYMAENGYGTPRNLARAAGLYNEAAKYGDLKAIVALATMFYFGDPVPQDLARAAGLFQEAAAKGWAIAAFNLGYMYDIGSGVESDRALALRWYRYADLLGYDPAGDELKRLGQ